MRENLLKYQKHDQHLIYTVYGKECENSKLLIKGKKDSNQSLKIDKDKDLEIFIVDRYGDAIKKEYEKEIIDKKEQRVCMKFHIYPNKSASSFIAYYKKKYYVFHPYFEDTKVFEEKEDAVKNLTHPELYPKSVDDYKRE